jgi:uncharacterized protein YbjT (DUF2867 family)
MIAVTGATGNIGKKVVHLLLSKGQKVRAIGRNKDKLNELEKAGSEIFVANIDDAAGLTKAFNGAEAVLVMTPGDYSSPNFRAKQNKIGDALTQAIEKSGIKYIVNISSVGAHRPDKMGPVNGLYDNEQKLNKLKDVNLLHLRPTYFMENLFMNLDLIKNMGFSGSPLKSDVKFPMIATQDIAVEAANYLIKRDFKGHEVKELLGQRDLSMGEVTRILGQAIGKPDLKYVQFPYPDAEKAMVSMGLSPDVAHHMIELNQSINEGIFKPTQARESQNTTKTSIEEFAKIFAAAFKGSAN